MNAYKNFNSRLHAALIAATAITLSMYLSSCEKDPPPEDPAPTVALEIIREYTNNDNICVYDGAALFTAAYPEGFLASYTLVEENRTRLMRFSAEGYLIGNIDLESAGARVVAVDSMDNDTYLLCLHRANSQLTTIMNITPGGDTLWAYTHAGDPQISDAVLTASGNIAFSTVRNRRAYVLILSAAGDSLRSFYVADTMPRFAAAPYVLNASDGALIIINNYNDSTINKFARISKFSETGTLQWQHTYGGFHLQDVHLLDDGKLLCTACGSPSRIVVLSNTGVLLNEYPYSQYEVNAALCPLQTGGYLVGILATLSKYDASGTSQWSGRYYDDLWEGSIQAIRILELNDGNYFLYGYRLLPDRVNPVVLRLSLK